MYKFRCVEPIMFIVACALNLELFSIQYMILNSSKDLHMNQLTLQHESTLKNTSLMKSIEDTSFKTATKWNLISNVAFGITSLLCAHFYGMLCDTFDIKKIITGLQICHLLPVSISIIAYFLKDPRVTLYLCLGFMTVFGLLGGVNVVALICSAYITQAFSGTDHTTKFSHLEAVNILGTMLPNIAGGFILDYMPFMVIPAIVASLLIISTLFSLCFLKPIYGGITGRSQYASTTSLSGYMFIKETFGLLPKERDGAKRFTLNICSASVILASIAVMGANALFYLYLRKSPIFFTNGEVGVFCGVILLFNGIGLLVLLPLLKKFINQLILCKISLLARSIMFFVIALKRQKLAIFCTLPLAILCNMEIPVLKSCASMQVESNEQGRLMGIFASFQSIGFTLSQFCILQVYLLTLTSYAGTPYLICGLLCLSVLPLLFSVFILKFSKKKSKNSGYVDIVRNISQDSTDDNVQSKLLR